MTTNITAISPRLNRIRVAGFRSLKDVTLELGPLTVLIGANGAGKSNFIGALRMLSAMRASSLQRFVREQGGASAILHYGASTTREIRFELAFEAEQAALRYDAELGFVAGDSLSFLDESARLEPARPPAQSFAFGAGHTESRVAMQAGVVRGSLVAQVAEALSGIACFHFHDTSLTSPLRQNARQDDNRALRPDGGNLAALLYRLRHSEAAAAQTSWALITGALRIVAPGVAELLPELVDPDLPEASACRLQWLDDQGHRFGPYDLSDGTLRALAIITALAQPATSLPGLIVFDEPELGLHPWALQALCSLISSTSTRAQVLVATQSPALLDHFAPEQVVVAERVDGATSLRRLDAATARAQAA